MDKQEFLELRNKLQQFEEEHSLELIYKETQTLNHMIITITEFIDGYGL